MMHESFTLFNRGTIVFYVTTTTESMRVVSCFKCSYLKSLQQQLSRFILQLYICSSKQDPSSVVYAGLLVDRLALRSLPLI
jgi:hypothetical protein